MKKVKPDRSPTVSEGVIRNGQTTAAPDKL